MTASGGKAWTRMFLADEVQSAVVNAAGFKARFGSLASHPYNRENPDLTVWWLFPRTRQNRGNWPAYSLGKYFFDRPRGRGVMRAGLHIEKGVDPRHAEGYGGERGRLFAMTKDWVWFSFVEALRSGTLAPQLAEVAKRSGEPVEVSVETSFAVDQPVVHEKFSRHRFTFTDGGGLTLVEDHPQPKKLPDVGKVTSLRELGDRFARATTEEPWTWINVFVCCAIPYHSEPPVAAGPAWNGSDFWEKVLEPLAGWVK